MEQKIKKRVYLLLSGIFTFAVATIGYTPTYNRGDQIEVGWDFFLEVIRSLIDKTPYFLAVLLLMLGFLWVVDR